MGIQGFAWRMQPYGSRRTIGRASDTNNTRLAVIDGPALAHSIIQDLQRKDKSFDGIEPRFNCHDLAKLLLSWLERLEAIGFEIHAIFFDGALPLYKLATRIDRLEKYLASLIKYKQAHDSAANAARNRKGPARKQGRSARKKGGDARNHGPQISPANLQEVEATKRRIAPPPFLVPAISEALFQSKYRDRTFVVPGEADAFCAAASSRVQSSNRHENVTIFTNDSDLIVYDSGLGTRVVLINSIEEACQPDEDLALEALEFHPSDLAKTMLFPARDLIKAAFQMLDLHTTFEQARKNDTAIFSDALFTSFAAEFDTSEATKALDRLGASSHDRIELSLDARISEIVVSTMALSKSSHKVRAVSTRKLIEDKASHQVHFFLPPLFEDPTRSSAWKIGQTFRNIAVSLLLHHNRIDAPVLEYRRSGTSIHATPIDIERHDSAFESLATWTTYLSTEMEKLSMHLENPNQRWLALLMHLVLTEIGYDEETQGLDIASMTEVLCRKNITTWSAAHLSGQLQAEYYSLRILAQISSYLQQNLVPGDPAAGFVGKFVSLMQSYPSISMFFDESALDERECQVLVNEYFAS